MAGAGLVSCRRTPVTASDVLLAIDQVFDVPEVALAVVGVVRPLSFAAAMVNTGRTNMGMDGTSFTIIASAWFSSFVRVASSSVRRGLFEERRRLRLQ